MPSFKIKAFNQSRKIGVKGSNLDDIIEQGKTKLKLDENQEYKIFLNDGTEIDDDEILIDFGQLVGAVLVIVPKDLAWDNAFIEESAAVDQAKQKPSTSSSFNITQNISTKNVIPTLFQKFSMSIVECCKKGKPLGARDRRSMIDVIAMRMIQDLKSTNKKTANDISKNLCTMYPQSFKSGLENVGNNVAEKVLAQNIYDAVNYRKQSHKNLPQKNDSDEEETGSNTKKKIPRKQDEYGCVEYLPLLPSTETPQSQEAKKLELINCNTRDDVSMEKILKLMDETYFSQRNYIVNNAICEDLFINWPHLTTR